METSIKIKDVPMDERPRERLLQFGEAKLSNNELLAILIGSGTKNDSAIDLANRILMHFEGLKLLREATIEELTAIKGIGKAKGISILAALELGKRIHTYKPDDRVTIKSPSDGADYVMEEMRHLNQEHLVAMFLNTKNQIIHRQTIFIGSL
ncbi:MAG TPA: DNA repair protein RadC, partial [Pseudogracilibacillus sp.]|nr:DNA repair protein RadC [Pseudogracilibacillus sp.]